MKTKYAFVFLAALILAGGVSFAGPSSPIAPAYANNNNGGEFESSLATTAEDDDDVEDDEENTDGVEDETEDGDDSEDDGEYTTNSRAEDCTFTSEGRNPFFILEPNYQLTLRGETEEGAEAELIVTVLEEVKEVDGIRTRVVEERESEDGELVEISRNFFAICEETNSVFYFGEEVDDYEDGQVVGHEGAWLSGEDDARAGIIMPGTILLGSRYHQEIAPDIAMDRAEIVEDDEVLETPADTFENVLVVSETTPLEPDVAELKYHAEGVGLIQDETLKLEEFGFADE
jgi:hypothetical protein